MGSSLTRRVRADVSYLTLRIARKRYACESRHSGCASTIEAGHQYVLSELPPKSEIGNAEWWRMRICMPCGHVTRTEVAEKLFGYSLPVVEWLIWSNHHKSWWGPNGSGCRRHIADAGRYALDDTPQWLGRGCGCCRVPEAVVPAPAAAVLTNPDALAEYARVAPERATREAVRTGRLNQYATWAPAMTEKQKQEARRG